jgi:hypothetical protein
MTEGKNPFTKKEGPDRENATDLIPDQDGVYKVPGDIKKPTEVEDHKISPEPQQDNPVPKWTYYETEPAAKPTSATDESVSVEPKESTKGATAKATKKPRDAKTGEWKLPEYEKMLREQNGNVLNKLAEKVKEGDVSSVKSRKVIYGAARDGLLSSQQADFEKIKEDFNKTKTETKEEKQLSNEDLDKMMDGAVKKDVESAVAGNKARFEAMRQEWRTNRDRADKLESEYAQKYEKHAFEQSKKMKGMLRDMFGIKPRLTPELKLLQEQADVARANFNRTATELMLFGGKRAERYKSRLSPKVAATLPYVMSKRLETQKKAANDAWGESKYLRPTLEAMKQHRSTLLGASLGLAVVTGGSVVPVLAAVGGAYVAGKSTMDIFNKLYVARERKRLSAVQSGVRQNYFERSYDDWNRELEKRTFAVWASESRTKTASLAAGIAGGLVAGGYAYSQIPPMDAGPISGGVDSGIPQTPDSPEFMGDMKVSEAMQPEVKEALAGLPNEAPIPEPRPELVDAQMHTVVKGENAWNIMEGKGPDANPIGGQSDFLKEMDLPMGERQELLDQAVKHLEQNQELAKEIGAVKSNGDIHKIYPGEQLNITKFDELLRQVYESNHPNLPETAPIPESAPEVSMSGAETADGTPLEEVGIHEPIETDVPGPDEFPEHGPVTVRGEGGTFVVEGRTADVDLMTIHDAMNLYQGVRVDDPNALGLLEEMSTDKESFTSDVEFMLTHGSGQPNDPNMLVGDYKELYKDMPYNTATESSSAANDNTAETAIVDTGVSISNPETIGANTENYIRGVERPSGSFLENLFGIGRPDVTGTFDQIKDFTLGDLKDMATNDNLPEGVSAEGFDRWVEKIGAAANDNDTFGNYISQLANSVPTT